MTSRPAAAELVSNLKLIELTIGALRRDGAGALVVPAASIFAKAVCLKYGAAVDATFAHVQGWFIKALIAKAVLSSVCVLGHCILCVHCDDLPGSKRPVMIGWCGLVGGSVSWRCWWRSGTQTEHCVRVARIPWCAP